MIQLVIAKDVIQKYLKDTKAEKLGSHWKLKGWNAAVVNLIQIAITVTLWIQIIQKDTKDTKAEKLGSHWKLKDWNSAVVNII